MTRGMKWENSGFGLLKFMNELQRRPVVHEYSVDWNYIRCSMKNLTKQWEKLDVNEMLDKTTWYGNTSNEILQLLYATLWSCKLQSEVTFITTARSNFIVTAVAVAESRKSFYLVQKVAQQNWVGNPSSTYFETCNVTCCLTRCAVLLLVLPRMKQKQCLQQNKQKWSILDCVCVVHTLPEVGEGRVKRNEILIENKNERRKNLTRGILEGLA